MTEQQPKATLCQQCGQPALLLWSDQVPLCADCYRKVAQATFMEQQARHNQLSWLASQQNLIQQDIYVGHGGLLPLKQMLIPPAPSAGDNYSVSHIQVSDSNVGVINSGNMTLMNTSIDVIGDRGDTDVATAIKDLTQAVLDDKDVEQELKKEIVEQLSFLASQAAVQPESRVAAVIKGVLSTVKESLSVSATLLTLWEKVGPLLAAYLAGTAGGGL